MGFIAPLTPFAERQDMKEVDVLYAGLCGSDINKIKRTSDIELSNLGHENVVYDSSQKRIYIINPFICSCNKECNITSFAFCKQCQSIGKRKEMGGGFSGRLFVPENNLFDYKVPFEYSVTGVFVDAAAVVFHALHELLTNKIKTCLILGDGTLAILSKLIIKDLFPEIETIVQIRRSERKEMIKNIISNEEIAEDEKALKKEYDLVIESVGGLHIETLNFAIEKCKNDGEIVVLGAFNENIHDELNVRTLFYKQIKIHGINSYCGVYNDFYHAVKWCERRHKVLRNLITYIVKVEEIGDTCLKIKKHLYPPFLKIVFKIN